MSEGVCTRIGYVPAKEGGDGRNQSSSRAEQRRGGWKYVNLLKRKKERKDAGYTAVQFSIASAIGSTVYTKGKEKVKEKKRCIHSLAWYIYNIAYRPS